MVMSNQSEQRICIKFCVKLRKTSTQIVEMLNMAFGDAALEKYKFLSGTNIFVKIKTTLKMMRGLADQRRQELAHQSTG